MQISFMVAFLKEEFGRGFTRMYANQKAMSTHLNHVLVHPRLVFFSHQTLKIVFVIDLNFARSYFRLSCWRADTSQSRRNPSS